MAQLRPSVLYTLLVLGGVLAGVGLIYGLFYDSEKFEGNRYENSYAEFTQSSLTEKQKSALTFLQSKGVEWAHFRFVEAIKNDDVASVTAFIDAGMPLNSNSILLEIALGPSANKKAMLSLLNKHYHIDLNALYRLPNYVSVFDQQLTAISAPYKQQKEEEYRTAMIKYKKNFFEWKRGLEKQENQLLSQCDNDACRGGRINDARLMFADSKPLEPTLDYISRERVNVSLLTIFAWQKDEPLITFMLEQGAELIPNKVFLTDAKLLYFMVDVQGSGSIISPKQK